MYKKFQQLLEAADTTPYQVGKATGISASTFSEWKKGTYTPKPDKIQKIADYFEVPVSYFYDDEEQKQTYYKNLATNYLAQKLRDDQKALMRSAVDLSPEEVVAVDMFIKALKGEK